jgi:hypothetical protein
MESSKHEDTLNPAVGWRGSGRSSDRADSGEGSYQTADTSPGTVSDGNDAAASESDEIFYFAAAAPGEHQTPKIGRREAPRLKLPMEEHEELWAMQESEIRVLRAEKRDLQEYLDELNIRLVSLRQKLAEMKQVKTGLETKIRELEHEVGQGSLVSGQLAEQNEELRRRLHELATKVGEGKKELSELSRTNNQLLRELEDATEDARTREKMTEALEAKVRQLMGIELRSEALQAEVDTLRDDLMEAQRQNKELGGRLREMATQIPQPGSAKSVGGKDATSSLEDEMWDVDSLNARDQEGGEERSPERAAHSTMGRRSSQPVGTADKREVRAQATNSHSAESQEEPQTIEFHPMSVETADGCGFGCPAKAMERGSSTQTTHILEIPGQLELQSTQPRTAGGKTGAEICRSSVESTVRRASISWWCMLLCLALLSWWCSHNDKHLWMQANEMTRKSVLASRDERWAASPWLARISFDAANMLQIDRSMFG